MTDERLNRIEQKLDKVADDLTIVRENVAALNVKAGIWGAVAGLLAALGFKMGSH